jgi:hypothetical protein
MIDLPQKPLLGKIQNINRSSTASQQEDCLSIKRKSYHAHSINEKPRIKLKLIIAKIRNTSHKSIQ